MGCPRKKLLAGLQTARSRRWGPFRRTDAFPACRLTSEQAPIGKPFCWIATRGFASTSYVLFEHLLEHCAVRN